MFPVYLLAGEIIFSIITTIISVLLIYAIVTKSPEKMAFIRPFLLKMVIADLCVEHIFCPGLLPYVYLPLPVFKINGFFKWFGTNGGFLATYFFITSLCISLTAVGECCIARFIITYNLKFLQRLLQGSWFIALQIAQLVICFSFLGICIYQFVRKAEQLETYVAEYNVSNIVASIDFKNDDVFIITIGPAFAIFCFFGGSFLALGTIMLLSFSYLTHKKIFSEAKLMSKENTALQRKLTWMLLIQITLPTVFIVLPIGVLGLMILIFYGLKWKTNIIQLLYDIMADGVKFGGMLPILCYPMLNTITTFIMIKPYRRIFYRVFPSFFKKGTISSNISRRDAELRHDSLLSANFRSGSVLFSEEMKKGGKVTIDRTSRWTSTLRAEEEIIFLAMSAQFHGKMYIPCNKTDPCLRLEAINPGYQFQDIPDHCDIFVGTICIIGLYEQEDPVFNKFRNLTLLIGQLDIASTLWNNLDIFQNLEQIYYYDAPGFSTLCDSNMYGLNRNPIRESEQLLRAGFSRFLATISLPRLKPLRPIELADSFSGFAAAQGGRREVGFDFTPLLPGIAETAGCQQFPAFGEGMCSYVNHYSEYFSQLASFVATQMKRNIEIRSISWIFTAYGVVLSFRSLLLTLHLKNKNLPEMNILLASVIILNMLLAIQGCFVNEKTFTPGEEATRRNATTILPIFTNALLLHPYSVGLMKLLAVAKYAGLCLIVLCYVGIILFYSTLFVNAKNCSIIYYLFAIGAAIICHIHLDRQSLIALRIFRPYYFDDAQYYTVFILHKDAEANFTGWAPSKLSIRHWGETLDFSGDIFSDPRLAIYTLAPFKRGPDRLRLDGRAEMFPEYCYYCDLGLVTTVALFFLLRILRFLHPPDNFNFLLLLYFQLSAFRFRAFLYEDILQLLYRGTVINPVSHRPVDVVVIMIETWFSNDNEYKTFAPFLLDFVDKSPNFFFPVVSFYSWRFARRHLYLGAISELKERKEAAAQVLVSQLGDASDIGDI